MQARHLPTWWVEVWYLGRAVDLGPADVRFAMLVYNAEVSEGHSLVMHTQAAKTDGL